MNASTSSVFGMAERPDGPVVRAAPEESNADPEPRSGMVIDGRYRLIEQIGSGGHASVYLASHLQLQREVALKILSRPQRDSERRRFRQEANLLAQLDHPNLVRIFDFGFVDQRPYICMERLEGTNLARWLERHGAMHPRRALALMMPAMDALALAHERAIVHKDIKPSNLFLVAPDSSDETLKVLDFGTARVADERHTVAGSRSGTAQYLAPEYVEDGSVSPASDVYQLAITLVEMLTGVALIAESGLSALERHVRGEFVLPTVLAQGPIGQVFRRALAADAAVRYADAGAFKRALVEIEDHFDPVSPLDTGELQQIDTRDLGPISTLTASTPRDMQVRRPERGERALLFAIIVILMVANAIIWLL